MSGERSQRPPPGYGGGRGPSFFDGFFGGDPFAHMDSMFRSMGMGADLLGGLGGSGGRTFQARQPSSTAREIPIEGPDDGGPPSAQHRLAGPLIDELPDHEQAGHEHLFFSSPDRVEEPEEEELLHDPKFQPPPIYHEPEQQQQAQQQQPAARAAEPSQPQAAPVPPPPWQSQQRYNSSSSSGGGQPSAEELLAAMGSLPLSSPQSQPAGRQAGGPGGWAAGGGGGDSEGPGSPLLVHMTNSTSPFSPQRGGHLLDTDRLPPHLPAFGSLGGRSGSGIGGGMAGGGMAGGAGGGMPPSAQVTQAPAAAAAAPLADWLTGAFGAGGQPPQGQQAVGGRPVSWDEHAGMFVATPVSSAQPPTAVQLPSGSPGEVAGAALRDSQPDGQGGGSRNIPPPSLFRSAGAGAEAFAATGAPLPLAQQMADGASQRAQQQQQQQHQRQRRLPAKLREAVEAQLHYGAQQQGAAPGRQRRATAGRKRPRGSSEEEEAEDAGLSAAAEEEDPDWAVPRRPRPASTSGGRPPKRGRRSGGASSGRTSRGGRR